MKKLMKAMSLTLAASLVVASLTACGGGEKTETKAEGGAAAAGEDVFLIGAIGPVTGSAASYGLSVKQGAQVAIDEINAAGGVVVGDKTYTLDMEFADDEATEDKAIQAYNTVMDKGADAILGAVTSGACIAITDLTAADGILQITPSGSAMECAKNDNAFRVCFVDSAQGKLAADFIDENNMPKDVAIFYQSDIDYSVGLVKSFKAEAEEKGITIKEEQTFTKDTATDFSTQISAIAASGVDLVFIPIYAAEASTFLTQASGKLDGKTFFGCDGLDGILTKVSDVAYAENVMMLTPFASDAPDENVQSFVKAYQDKYGSTPDQFAADGYDAVYAIKAAVEKAGIESSDDADLCSKLVAAMYEITVEGVTGTMTWDETNEAVKAARAMIIHNGVAELYAE